MSARIAVALTEKLDGPYFGISIDLEMTGGKLPDVVVYNSLAFAFETIDDDGHPVYVRRHTCVYSQDHCPEPVRATP